MCVGSRQEKNQQRFIILPSPFSKNAVLAAFKHESATPPWSTACLHPAPSPLKFPTRVGKTTFVHAQENGNLHSQKHKRKHQHSLCKHIHVHRGVHMHTNHDLHAKGIREDLGSVHVRQH